MMSGSCQQKISDTIIICSRSVKKEEFMNKKKRIVAALVCILAVYGFVGCGNGVTSHSKSKAASQTNMPVDEKGKPGPFGKYKEPVTVEIIQSINPTLPIPEGESTTDNYFTRFIKEAMNIDIKVKWQASTANYNQKLNLAIASNDLPDVMVVGEQEFKKLVKTDAIEDLTPYYEQYASDIIKKNIAATDGKSMASASVDGKMYGLPNVRVEADGYNLMWIRQDWLDKLHLPAPKTVAELENVAKAFVDNKMGGSKTIGVLGPTVNGRLYNDFLSPVNNLCNLDGVFQAYKSWPGFWITGKDSKAVYGSITPETKKALGELQKMYKRGILDQELGVRKSADEAWKSGQAGILFSPWWHGYNVYQALANDPSMEWRAYAAPVAEDGNWYPKLGSPTDSYVVVRKGYAHPEAAFLLNNFLRRDEAKLVQQTQLDLSYYPVRVVITSIDENSFSVKVLRKYFKGEKLPDFDPINYKLLNNDISSAKEIKKEPYDDFSIKTWNTSNKNFGRLYSLLVGSGSVVDAENQGIMNKVYSVIYSQTETMDRKWTNLKKKEDETFLKIIIGEEPLDEFDTFVEQWKAEGGDEITAEVQESIQK